MCRLSMSFSGEKEFYRSPVVDEIALSKCGINLLESLSIEGCVKGWEDGEDITVTDDY